MHAVIFAIAVWLRISFHQITDAKTGHKPKVQHNKVL